MISDETIQETVRLLKEAARPSRGRFSMRLPGREELCKRQREIAHFSLQKASEDKIILR